MDMGLLDALVESSARFQREHLLPIGYARRGIAWVVNIPEEGDKKPTVLKKERHKGKWELELSVPATPADRTSGKASPSLLVDKISYVFGIANKKKKGDGDKIAEAEHKAFVSLLRHCKEEMEKEETEKQQLSRIYEVVTTKSVRISDEAKPNDLCAFQIGKGAWLTDSRKIQSFWSKYMSERLSDREPRVCVICRTEKPIVRILPFKITLLSGTDPVQISSFNLEAFCSGGSTTKSAFNSPICYECAGVAVQILQFLVQLNKNEEGNERNSGRHAVVAARDNKASLGNQVAVFWTKEKIQLESPKGESLSFEDVVKLPLEEYDGDEAPVRAGQLRQLLESPFVGGKTSTDLPSNRFYLGILSPNKSRLVVREWLESDIDPVRDSIRRYNEALQIIHPHGGNAWSPPLLALLEALQSYTSSKQKSREGPRIPSIGPEGLRKLIRCIYTGTPPPEIILTRALRCFRVPDPPTDESPLGREQRNRQLLRRMALAACMKLILTHNKDRKEQQAMERRRTESDGDSEYKRKSPYHCGTLLAILEAIQRRASSSGRGVNTTLVDKFYGAASTAPATVFAHLINTTTKAHLPKLRREGKESFKLRDRGELVNISDLMSETCKAIDDSGGFPAAMRPEEQAAFALGFYHQRAEFSMPSKKEKPPEKEEPTATNDATMKGVRS
jgi:CRISPR-associated protein Csd1